MRQTSRAPRWARTIGIAVAASAALLGCTGTGAGENSPASLVPENRSDPAPAGIVFPDASTTRVPPGTALESSDSLTVTVDGTLVEGLDIKGTVTVKADDVVIRNTRITSTGVFPVRLVDASNLLIEDSEIDGKGRAEVAVVFKNYTLRRVNIHAVMEGPRIAGGNVTIEDSYIHSLTPVEGNHTDLIQILGGSNIVLRGNTLAAYNPETGAQANAALMIGDEDSRVTECLIEGNYMNGGNYTVNTGGGGGERVECRFRGNWFGRDARYGLVAHLGQLSIWETSNVWRDTGLPAE